MLVKTKRELLHSLFLNLICVTNMTIILYLATTFFSSQIKSIFLLQEKQNCKTMISKQIQKYMNIKVFKNKDASGLNLCDTGFSV